MALSLFELRPHRPETSAKDAVGDSGGHQTSLPVARRSIDENLHGFWYTRGSHNGCDLWKVPDDMSMAAITSAISRDVMFR